MFELNAMGIYTLTMVICLVFIMVLLSRQKRTGKDVAVWFFAGIVGIMMGIGGTLSAINLTDHQIVDVYEMEQPFSEEEEGGEGGGGGRGGGGRGGGGRGGFDPAAIFAERDADGDGKLTGDEISGRMEESAAEIDTDGDGSITLEEFQARMQSRSGGGRGRGGSGEGESSEDGEELEDDEDGSDQEPSEDEADRPPRPESDE